MKKKQRLVLGLLILLPFVVTEQGLSGQNTNTYNCNLIPGPVSVCHYPDGSNTGWFPDSRFAVIGGGPEAYNCMSWWMQRVTGNSLDSTTSTPGAEYIGGGPYGSGDRRGYWIQSVIRPTDYGVSGAANLFLFAVNNTSLAADPTLLIGATVTAVGTNPNTVASTTGYPSTGPGTPFTVTINSSYLIGFCHVEDYSSSGISNNSRTIYSFDNGLHWVKGPWVNYGAGGVITTVDGTGKYSPTGTPVLFNMGGANATYTADLLTATTGTMTTSLTGSGTTSSGGLMYNRYMQQWVSLYATSYAYPQVNAGVVASGDLHTWYKCLPYGGFYYEFSQQGESQSGNYPTLVGGYPTSMAPGKSLTMECGQLAWLYNNTDGLTGRALGFIKATQQDITWTGTVNTNLDTTGNWKISPGYTGTFTGFVDEANSLTLGGSGGTLANNIPSSNRVRAITYPAGTGAYTLTGTTALSMEAYVVHNSNPSNPPYYDDSVYGIHNLSSSVQEIDSPINVRTAALYLQTDSSGSVAGTTVSGCALKLTGPIDMMGSGGIVVVGSGVTVISGGINDSGYTDFSTGQPEYIASCNEGMLVKNGTGTLVLSGTGSFQGTTSIVSGVVQLNGANALQNSVVSVTTGNANSLVLDGNSTIGGLIGSDDISLGGYSLKIGNNNTNVTNQSPLYSGSLSGLGAVTKVGASVQYFSGYNTYSGGTTLAGGNLIVPASANTAFGSGTLTFNGGTVTAQGAITSNNAIALSSGGGEIDTNGEIVILNGVISGSGSLLSEGAGLLILTGSNTFSGGVIADNTVQITQNGALGTGTLQLNGGTLQFGASVDLGSAAIEATAASNIDTQNFNATDEGAIVSGAGIALTKEGTGTFVWSGDGSNFDGNLVVAGGVFVDAQTGTASIFSSGNVTLNGSTLAFQPSGSGANVSVSLATAAGSLLTVNGSGVIALNQGSNASLAVSVGSASNLNALSTGTTSAVLLSVAGGSSTLGQSNGVRLLVDGIAATPAGQIYSPATVVAGTNNIGDFVTYNTTNGFTTFTGYTTETGTFANTSGTITQVTNITGAAMLSNASYAQALRIAGTNTLNLNGHTYTMNGTGSTSQAGVLLNGGAMLGGTLAFGGHQGTIYVGGPSATLTSAIAGTAGIVFTGAPGTQVTLGGSNSFTGGLTIVGTKVVATETGLGSGGSPVTLDGQGTLCPTIAIWRNLTVNSGGGAIEIDGTNDYLFENPVAGPGSLHKTGTGTLEFAGDNTSTGSFYIDAGVVDFDNSGTLDRGSGNIYIANGAAALMSTYTGFDVDHAITLSGTGPAGQGALLVSGAGTFNYPVTLAGDALIAAQSGGSTAIFQSSITAPNCSLTLESNYGALTLAGPLDLGTGTLTFEGTSGAVLSSTYDDTHTGPIVIVTTTPVVVNGTIDGTSGITVNGILCGTGASISTTGTISVTSGGVIIPGTYSGSFANAAGPITVAGDITLNSGATFQSYVANAQGISSGANTTSGNGVVVDEGTANLGGTLDVVCSGSYTPASGDALWLVLRNAGTGTFSTVNVYTAGNSTPTWTSSSLVDGGSITVNGVTGTFHYTGHNSLDLTTGDSDVSITFP